MLPKPREATSVAIRIGDFPLRNSKTEKVYQSSIPVFTIANQ